MTETVSLALMALVGAIVLVLAFIIIACMSLQNKPSWFKLWTKYGHFEMHFDNSCEKSDG